MTTPRISVDLTMLKTLADDFRLAANFRPLTIDQLHATSSGAPQSVDLTLFINQQVIPNVSDWNTGIRGSMIFFSKYFDGLHTALSTADAAGAQAVTALDENAVFNATPHTAPTPLRRGSYALPGEDLIAQPTSPPTGGAPR